jgi:hypothetical protein
MNKHAATAELAGKITCPVMIQHGEVVCDMSCECWMQVWAPSGNLTSAHRTMLQLCITVWCSYSFPSALVC